LPVYRSGAKYRSDAELKSADISVVVRIIRDHRMRLPAVVVFIIATLFMTCAGAEDPPSAKSSLQASFGNMGLGGNWVTLARNGKTLNHLIGADALVCAREGGALDITLVPTNDPSHAHWSIKIPPGQCRCAPRPALLLAQNADEADGNFAGTFRWIRAHKCPKTTTADVTTLPSAFSLGAVERRTAACQPLNAPGGYYSASCKIELPLLSFWTRICMDPGWVVAKDGASFPDGGFPARFARLITDEKLLQADIVAQNLEADLRWSFVTQGCIDLFHVAKAWMVLHGDANIDTTNVREIAYSVQRLKPWLF